MTGTVEVSTIQKLIGKYYDISKQELLSASREQQFARPRMVGMYLARELTEHSLPALGRFFGGRDHTTVLNAQRTIRVWRRADQAFNAEVGKLEKILARYARRRETMYAKPGYQTQPNPFCKAEAERVAGLIKQYWHKRGHPDVEAWCEQLEIDAPDGQGRVRLNKSGLPMRKIIYGVRSNIVNGQPPSGLTGAEKYIR